MVERVVIGPEVSRELMSGTRKLLLHLISDTADISEHRDLIQTHLAYIQSDLTKIQEILETPGNNE